MKAEGVPIERHNPHKDLTDGQLACSLALDMGVKEAVILGGWGGRADHSFANLMMMRYMAEQGVCVRMRCPEQWVKVCGPGRHEVTGTLGGTFSLLPISDGVVVRSIEGAEYPLSEPTAMPLGPTLIFPWACPTGFWPSAHILIWHRAGFCAFRLPRHASWHPPGT